MASVRAKPKMTYRIGRRSASQPAITVNMMVANEASVTVAATFASVRPRWMTNGAMYNLLPAAIADAEPPAVSSQKTRGVEGLAPFPFGCGRFGADGVHLVFILWCGVCGAVRKLSVVLGPVPDQCPDQ